MIGILFLFTIIYAVISPYCKRIILNDLIESEYIIAVGIFFFVTLIFFIFIKNF